MSLTIDVEAVERVLLNDGWHHVANQSFTLDSYEFIWNHEGEYRGTTTNFRILHGGDQSGVCATGFQFVERDGNVISGPLTAIHAVSCKTNGETG